MISPVADSIAWTVRMFGAAGMIAASSRLSLSSIRDILDETGSRRFLPALLRDFLEAAFVAF